MIADIAGHSVENGVEILGYMNGDTHQHVTFQYVKGDPNLYFEFDDQSNGGYNCVTAVGFGDRGVTIFTDKAPGGAVRVTVPKDVANRELVATRLAEILALHDIKVTKE